MVPSFGAPSTAPFCSGDSTSTSYCLSFDYGSRRLALSRDIRSGLATNARPQHDVPTVHWSTLAERPKSPHIAFTQYLQTWFELRLRKKCRTLGGGKANRNVRETNKKRGGKTKTRAKFLKHIHSHVFAHVLMYFH